MRKPEKKPIVKPIEIKPNSKLDGKAFGCSEIFLRTNQKTSPKQDTGG